MHYFFHRHPRWYLYLFFFALLCGMLFFPQIAAAGALKGLLLWFETLLPVLLPFLFLSGLLIRLDMTRPLNRMLSPVLCRFLPISPAACYPLLLGLFCGMPLGAKTTATLYQNGSISHADATFLLAASNHASLMFLVSYLIANKLQQPAHTFAFLAIIYLSGLCAALLLRPRPVSVPLSHPHDSGDLSSSGIHATAVASHPSKTPGFFEALDDSVGDGLQTITKIGGYIILFSMLSGFLMHCTWLVLPLRATAAGIFEITGGIQLLCETSLPVTQKTALTLAITSFGGLSGLMQTRSVTLGSGLSIKLYFVQKCVQAGITYLLTLLIMQFC
ncbi:MAG: hypothetical protein IJY09_08585 [Lachnospiraceae bacterium]|nr:hypothetical protein [Lachnospiraceae bacterium]